jgi:hypothetical protein
VTSSDLSRQQCSLNKRRRHFVALHEWVAAHADLATAPIDEAAVHANPVTGLNAHWPLVTAVDDRRHLRRVHVFGTLGRGIDACAHLRKSKGNIGISSRSFKVKQPLTLTPKLASFAAVESAVLEAAGDLLTSWLRIFIAGSNGGAFATGTPFAVVAMDKPGRADDVRAGVLLAMPAEVEPKSPPRYGGRAEASRCMG